MSRALPGESCQAIGPDWCTQSGPMDEPWHGFGAIRSRNRAWAFKTTSTLVEPEPMNLIEVHDDRAANADTAAVADIRCRIVPRGEPLPAAGGTASAILPSAHSISAALPDHTPAVTR